MEKESFMSYIPIQKTLSKKELYTLIQKYQKNHDQKSKEIIILSNTKLVLSLMKRFYQKSNHYEDLFQVGIVGLIKAIDHFDTNYQLQFSTYAVPLIIGEMKRYLRDNTQVKISRPIKDLAYAILKEKEKYLNQYQREPTINELSQNLNIDKKNIIEAIQSTQSIASFQDVVGSDDQNELSLLDVVSLDQETLKHYHDHLDLKKAFDCLNQREKQVIQERYYQGYSQCEIADELFVSQAQISRIEKKALEKLHKRLV
ncbi:MAG: sigma-70 family RNA polymerase sigma factor [Faecalibacillus sp.]|uniref:sigma-70 family RNA polymerase sigma factor n=1 Tax=Faecalibacillus sp. TaxID=2678891 RepID=UPI00295F3428|nr:sigma-70 family RNA polymerase sigma factor [uncultured Faecalibacillus sp.]